MSIGHSGSPENLAKAFFHVEVLLLTRSLIFLLVRARLSKSIGSKNSIIWYKMLNNHAFHAHDATLPEAERLR